MDQIPASDAVTEITPPSAAGPIPLERIDADAVKVLQRLRKQGFEAYLVGGCVRDLLLGLKPKDFDVATNARPRQIKRLFRNSRIIGRRFKLVHVTFGPKIIEVSTFRGPPAASGDSSENGEPGELESSDSLSADLLILRDNAFGTLEEDAQRRDFTINALFYDVDGQRVLDSVGGQADLERRVVRTIGDPQRRVREDPVRILRAVKFATRLRFSIDAELFAAMREYHADIARAAPPRVIEEILRILGSGSAAEAMALLHELEVLTVLFPELGVVLDTAEQREENRRLFLRALEALDRLDRGQRGFSNAVFLGTLFALPVLTQIAQLQQSQSRRDPGLLVDEILRPFARHTRLARRDLSRMKSMYLAQRRFEQADSRRRRGTRLGDLVRRDYFDDAFTLFRILSLAHGQGERVTRWEERLRDVPRPVAGALPSRRRKHRRRRSARRPEAPTSGSPAMAADTDGDNWEIGSTGEQHEPAPPAM
ncbi:MAG: polynucleotide adenylyltransferase PcnB [Planctomycetota bacterium]